MPPARDTLASLRRTLAGLERGGEALSSDLFPLGAREVDEALCGGLARRALHEVYPSDRADAAAATGFAAALSARAAGSRPVVWARQDSLDQEAGHLYAPGLLELGLDPGNLILVRAQDAVGVLRASAEAVRCAKLGAVLLEVWGTPRAIDLTATRRLALAAGRSGVPLLMIRMGAEPAPSAAMTRWAVRAGRSAPLPANSPGHPAFVITLLRHRAGLPTRAWQVEWDRDRRSFDDFAPLSRSVVPVPADRPAAAERLRPFRRAG